MSSYIEIDLCQDLLKYLKIEFLARIIAPEDPRNPPILDQTSIDPISTLICYMDRTRIAEYAKEAQLSGSDIMFFINQERLRITVHKMRNIDFPEMNQYFYLKGGKTTSITKIFIQRRICAYETFSGGYIALVYSCIEKPSNIYRTLFIILRNAYPYEFIHIKFGHPIVDFFTIMKKIE